jgi:ribosome-associated translation inhibitor RaiA
MRITVSSMNMLVSADTRGYVEYRFFSALAPYSASITAVQVELSKPIAADSPVLCTAHIELAASGPVTAAARGVQATAAADRAADRVAWQLRQRGTEPESRLKASRAR